MQKKPEIIVFAGPNGSAKALALLPELIQVCDICHIYDNSLETAFRIFKKRKEAYFFWENKLWSKQKIEALVNIKLV